MLHKPKCREHKLIQHLLPLSSKSGRTRVTCGFEFASPGGAGVQPLFIVMCSTNNVVFRFRRKTPGRASSEPDLQSKNFAKSTSSSQWRKRRGCIRVELRLKRLTAIGVKGGIWTRLFVGRMQVHDEMHSMKTFWKMLSILYLQTSLLPCNTPAATVPLCFLVP